MAGLATKKIGAEPQASWGWLRPCLEVVWRQGWEIPSALRRSHPKSFY